MRNIQRYEANVVADGSGNATVAFNSADGIIMQLHYVAGTLASGTDITIVEDETTFQVYAQLNIGTIDYQRLPRMLIADAEDGVIGSVYDYIAVRGNLTLNVSGGGAGGTGTFYIYIAK